MFGFQRVGDMIWAFADSRGKGFLMGGTAGRTTMLGEGLQHQDGHSHVLASTVPTCLSYDPAYVYEMAVILQDGIRRMYQEGEDVFYYLTMYNEDYAMPAMPEGVARRHCARHVPLPAAAAGNAVAQLFGSGPILNEVVRAQDILAEKYGVRADVWSVTSYNELRREALDIERWNRLHPTQPEKSLHSQACRSQGPIIAASDYMKSLPDSSRPGFPPGWSRWAPTASAAATTASISAVTSRSTRSPLWRQRFPGWRAMASSTRRGPSRHSQSWVWIRKRPIRPTCNRVLRVWRRGPVSVARQAASRCRERETALCVPTTATSAEK